MTPPEVDPRVLRTREVVVDATAALLTEVGFERICIDTIAERSGVARSTIYRNWPQRTALLLDAFGRFCAKGTEPIVSSGHLGEDLWALGRRLVSQLGDDDWGRTVPSLMSAATHDPELAEAMADFSAQKRKEAVALLSQAVERGEISRAERVESALERFVSPFFFRRLLTRLPLDDAFLESQVDAFLRELGAT